jgi:hypothetical protein
MKPRMDAVNAMNIKLVTANGSVTICGNFIMYKPYVVSRMATIDSLPMADDRRGLLTSREREILSGKADVSDEYYYSVVSRVRRKIQEIEDDAQLLRKHHEDLYEELNQAIIESDDEADNE